MIIRRLFTLIIIMSIHQQAWASDLAKLSSDLSSQHAPASTPSVQSSHAENASAAAGLLAPIALTALYSVYDLHANRYQIDAGTIAFNTASTFITKPDLLVLPSIGYHVGRAMYRKDRVMTQGVAQGITQTALTLAGLHLAAKASKKLVGGGIPGRAFQGILSVGVGFYAWVLAAMTSMHLGKDLNDEDLKKCTKISANVTRHAMSHRIGIAIGAKLAGNSEWDSLIA